MANEVLSKCWEWSFQSILDWLSNEQKKELLKILEKDVADESFYDPEYDYDDEFNCFSKLHFGMWEAEYEAYYSTNGENDESEGTLIESLPDRLSEYRSLWKQKIRWVSPETKEKIIKAAENIKCEVKTLENWARDIHLQFWKHWWTNLYFTEYPLNSSNVLWKYAKKGANPITWWYSTNVNLAWIEWPNPDDWEDYKIKEYLNYENKIPTIEWIRSVFNILWNFVGLHEEREQIALMMYLTGMEWIYWLWEWEVEELFSSKEYSWHRTFIVCDPNVRGFGDYFYEEDNTDLNGKLFSIRWSHIR